MEDCECEDEEVAELLVANDEADVEEDEVEVEVIESLSDKACCWSEPPDVVGEPTASNVSSVVPGLDAGY